MQQLKECLKSIGLVKRLIRSYPYVYFRDVKNIHKICQRMGRTPSHSLVKDMVDMHRLHEVPYDEFFLFNFDKNDNEEYRASFITDIERVKYANALNNPDNDTIYYDKGKTYTVYQQYYLRDVLRLDSLDRFSQFESFVKKHNRFICKPIDGGCGVGIQILSIDEHSNLRSVFDSLIEQYQYKCIIEELIQQVPELSELHPDSINTMRMPTIRTDNGVMLLHPFLRIGRGGNITDNAGSGGIFCCVDINTGKVFTATDEFDNSYEIHPDTGKQLIGFQVPEWKAAVELVKKLALIVPDNRYCGWDLALTEKGWDLVEANAKGQFIWQYGTKIGFKEELEMIFKDIDFR